MTSQRRLFGNENGSAMVITLLILVTTLTMGIFATTTSVNELQIAGADLQQKMAFYQADGGQEFGVEVLEQNIACFSFEEDEAGSGKTVLGDVDIEDLDAQSNEISLGSDDPASVPALMSERAFLFPSGASMDEPHTEISLAGDTGPSKGSAMEMAAGYEGIGKGLAGSGAETLYLLYSRRFLHGKTAATVAIGWRHKVGQEEECRE